jgi:hypothetical protein
LSSKVSPTCSIDASFWHKNTTSSIRYWILLKIRARSHGFPLKYG